MKDGGFRRQEPPDLGEVKCYERLPFLINSLSYTWVLDFRHHKLKDQIKVIVLYYIKLIEPE
jgi:hypothetical protein